MDIIQNRDAASNSYETATPTPTLRYAKTGELQQAWNVIEYSGGRPIAARVEWRGIQSEQ